MGQARDNELSYKLYKLKRKRHILRAHYIVEVREINREIKDTKLKIEKSASKCN